MMSRLMLNIRDPKLRIGRVASDLETPVFRMNDQSTTRQTRTQTIQEEDRTLDMGAVPWMRDPEDNPLILVPRGFVPSQLSIGDTPMRPIGKK